MTIPSTIKVGPFRYKVVATKEAIAQERYSCEDSTRLGSTHFHTGQILVDPDLFPDQFAETLTHESLHAMMRTAAMETDDEKFSPEEIASRLAPILLSVLRDNPELVAFLRKE